MSLGAPVAQSVSVQYLQGMSLEGEQVIGGLLC